MGMAGATSRIKEDQTSLNPMSILNPVPIWLIIENPAYHLTNTNIVVDIPLDSDSRRPATANILPAFLHLLETLLPQGHIQRSQINPALLCPGIHIIISNPHAGFYPLGNANKGTANDLITIR